MVEPYEIFVRSISTLGMLQSVAEVPENFQNELKTRNATRDLDSCDMECNELYRTRELYSVSAEHTNECSTDNQPNMRTSIPQTTSRTYGRVFHRQPAEHTDECSTDNQPNTRTSVPQTTSQTYGRVFHRQQAEHTDEYSTD